MVLCFFPFSNFENMWNYYVWMAPFYVTIGNTFKNCKKNDVYRAGDYFNPPHILSFQTPQNPALKLSFGSSCSCVYVILAATAIFMFSFTSILREQDTHTSNKIRHCNHFIHNTFFEDWLPLWENLLYYLLLLFDSLQNSKEFYRAFLMFTTDATKHLFWYCHKQVSWHLQWAGKCYLRFSLKLWSW